jgi:hypothetical protein
LQPTCCLVQILGGKPKCWTWKEAPHLAC